MFTTAVCTKADPAAPPPDVAAVVWQELKLDNNPKLCTDTKLRESALAMIAEVEEAFHKPDPLLRPILNKDGTPVQVHVHTTDEIPLSSRMYRVSPDRLPAMRDKLNEMLEQGVILRSHSSWSSPASSVGPLRLLRILSRGGSGGGIQAQVCIPVANARPL
jgi:hypothetical protein